MAMNIDNSIYARWQLSGWYLTWMVTG